MKFGRRASIALLVLLFTSTAFAKDWWEAYADGIKAAKSSNWSTVVSKMGEAIEGNPSENERARPYGTIFVNYKPYYYRGVANFKLGNYREALADLKKTKGPGELNLGDTNDLLDRINDKLNVSVPPPPPPTTTRESPPPPTTTREIPPPPPPTSTSPIGPTQAEIALRQARDRADAMLRQASVSSQSAQRINAGKYDKANFTRGQTLLQQASSARASAANANDWNRVADLADASSRAFDAARVTTNVAISKGTATVEGAADVVLSDVKVPLKNGLRDYFAGRFERASITFQTLTAGPGRDYPLLWAFQGASIYYDYYLAGSADLSKKKQAEEAFRQAKRLKPGLTLSKKYFSPRVRRFFDSIH